MGNKKEVRKVFSELSCDPGKDAHVLSASGAGYSVGNPLKTQEPNTLWSTVHILKKESSFM